MARITAVEAGGQNVCAFLDMLAWSEIGPELLAHSDDGYDVLVGSTGRGPLLFDSYASHPNVFNRRYNSTAAGRYQLLHRYWPAYQSLLKLPDFGPESQDRIAIQQIREQHALADVIAGRLADAIGNVSNIWASLPGAGYGQHEQHINDLRAAYVAAGGVVA
jgi:muramidase (phage lysozyme)